MEVALLLGGFLTLIALRCPLAYALLISSICYLVLAGLPTLVVPQKITTKIDTFPMLAIPMFLLAGNLMNQLGITDRIFHLSEKVVGHIAGGLAQVNILASVIFAGMSGSSIADAGGLGAVEMRAMRQAGYNTAFSAAVTAASATIGPIIPPSINMIIYGHLVDESIARLFAAGVVPGLLMGLSLSTIVYIQARRGRYECPVSQRASVRELGHSLRHAAGPILAPVILVGGILSGVFTPTEAGVVAVFYVLVLGLLYHRFDIKAMLPAFDDTLRTTAATLFIIAMSMIFGWIVTLHRVPEAAAGFFAGWIDSQAMVMLFVVLLLLVLGTVMDAVAVLIITVPSLYAMTQPFGVDPAHLGMVVIVALTIGSITPPVGLVMFTVQKVAGLPTHLLVRALLPLYVPLVVALILIAVFPELSLWLPDLLFD